MKKMRPIKNWLKFPLLLALLLGFSCHVASAKKISGQLELKLGVVKVRRQGSEVILRRKGAVADIIQGDVIHTGPDSKVIISFRNKFELIELFPNSHLVIEAFSIQRTFLGLGMGKALIFRDQILFSRYQFKVRTPVVEIGIKGTEFLLATDKTKTYLLTLFGAVQVNQRGSEKFIEVIKKNYLLFSSRDKLPLPPIKLKTDLLDRLKKDAGLTGFQILEKAVISEPNQTIWELEDLDWDTE